MFAKSFLFSKRLATGLLSLVLGALVVFGTVNHSQAQVSGSVESGTVLDEIVAVVDGNLILRSDLDLMLAQVTQGRQLPPAQAPQIKGQVLQQLINQEVMLIHAKQDTTIQVSDEEVDKQLEQQIQQLAGRLGGTEQLEQQYGKSIVEIKNEYQGQIRDQLLSQRFLQRKRQQISITPSEVKTWFNRIPQDSLPTIPKTVRVAHIVRYPETDPAARKEAQELINSIRDSVLEGASFEELAKKHSEGPAASTGGHYQNFNVNELVPELGAVASQLEEGDVSQVFESQFGFHIMRLNQKRGDIVDFNNILIRVNQERTISDEVVARLRALRDSVVNSNASFEKLAKEYSEEPNSAQRGGYVTNPATGERDLPIEQLGSSWQSTLDTMEVGEVSKPTKVQLMQSGQEAWHIVLLQKRAPAHVANLQDDYQRIYRLALQQKQQREIQQWITKLREDIYINVKDSQLANVLQQ